MILMYKKRPEFLVSDRMYMLLHARHAVRLYTLDILLYFTVFTDVVGAYSNVLAVVYPAHRIGWPK